jgi:hypothetical protein
MNLEGSFQAVSGGGGGQYSGSPGGGPDGTRWSAVDLETSEYADRRIDPGLDGAPTFARSLPPAAPHDEAQRNTNRTTSARSTPGRVQQAHQKLSAKICLGALSRFPGLP